MKVCVIISPSKFIFTRFNNEYEIGMILHEE